MKFWKDFLEIKAENKRKRIKIKSIKGSRKEQISILRNNIDEEIYKASSKTKIEELELKKNNLLKEKLKSNKKGDIINLKNIEKYFVTGLNIEHILKNINVDIKRGEMVTILGQSGSGKSTLLNIMSGLLTPENGEVIVNGKDLFLMNEKELTNFRKETLSFVFQSYNLIPTLTVKENITVGENLRSKNDKEISMKEILETLDLVRQQKKYPYQLSGGQNQRISIGRALAKNPKILFADEPTGALDEEKGKEVLELLIKINEKFKTTIIMVTHNPNIASLCDKVINLKDGEINSVKINKTRKKVSELKWS